MKNDKEEMLALTIKESHSTRKSALREERAERARAEWANTWAKPVDASRVRTPAYIAYLKSIGLES